MASEPAAVQRSPIRAWLPPALVLLLLVALLGGVALVALATREEPPPPEPGPFVTPGPLEPTLAYTVQRVDENGLTLTRGDEATTTELRTTIPDSARVDFLEPSAGVIQPGDWITVIGVRNEVRNFAIRSIVVISGGGVPEADGWVRTAAGFVGHEAARDPGEAPILAGKVVETGEGVVVLGPERIELFLGKEPPLRFLRGGSVAEIQGGDRIAFHLAPDGTIDPAAGVLVLVGGTR